ncbi:MAG: universal stress protein, partial [Anaerolineae bacterium]|nr:universal stress protein [Anaerolineae bacterium]
MDTDFSSVQSQAEVDFQRARTRAFWSDLIDRLRGKNVDLLNFDEVKQKLRLRDDRHLGLQDIPLNKIVGSVGRHNDFNRRFLPRKSISKERWKAVDALALGLTGFPPIEVYKVGDAYFVVDGNHRVSVARANNMETIEAYVT